MLDPPGQIDAGEADAVTFGKALTETVTDAAPEQPLAFVPVTE